MTEEDHGRTAIEFLEASDREFEAGDHLQASEKLWGAATHAVMAAAIDRKWKEYRTHRAMKNAVVPDYGPKKPTTLGLDRRGLPLLRRFHKNFYHDEMHDYDIRGRK